MLFPIPLDFVRLYLQLYYVHGHTGQEDNAQSAVTCGSSILEAGPRAASSRVLKDWRLSKCPSILRRA